MNKKSITIGLDRDGTINQDIGSYVLRPDQFIPIPGSIEAVTLLKRKGYNVVILTNQAGIMKGLMTPSDVDAVHEYMLQLLGQAGCSSIDGIYYSTTNLKDDIYAKPNVGMFKRAEVEQRLKFKGGAFVGDKISDLKAADKIHALPVLVRTGHGLETIEKLETFSNRNLKKKTQIFNTLWDFADSLPWLES
jgi:D-glycero-D-manno-heptose 1,7-bisphosphate phosphatase